jgi:hypothetical protein
MIPASSVLTLLLRQAFRKLSIASRVDLTRIVIEQAADGS